MQNIEQQALATYKQTLPLWLRYVDDTFTAVNEHLNKQNTYIQFTRKIEENGKIPFLDCLVSRDNNKLRTTVYRKPKHTDRLLDQCSLSPHLSQSDCCTNPNKTSTSSLRPTQQPIERNQHLHDVFHKNNNNQDFVSRIYYRENGPNSTNTRPTTVTMATVPYIKGTCETIARILQPFVIRVSHKPITILKRPASER